MGARLIVGLGNPGSKYAAHRHNIGFMVADHLAQRFGDAASGSPFRAKFKGSFAKLTLRSGADVVVLKPETFMNLSGRSVREAMTFFKVPLPEVVVVHDELDLALGALKVKVGGGLAGHNGLKSIAECCGGSDFIRLRMGIGRPRSGEPKNHVLGDFAKDEGVQVEDMIESASAALVDVVEHGPQAAMNLHNRSV